MKDTGRKETPNFSQESLLISHNNEKRKHESTKKRNLSINCHKSCSLDTSYIAELINNMHGGTDSINLREYFQHAAFEFRSKIQK